MLPTFQSHLGGGQPSPLFPMACITFTRRFAKRTLSLLRKSQPKKGHRGARLPSASRAANAVHVVLDGVGHMVVHHLEKCGTPRPRQKKHHPNSRWPICFCKNGGKKNDLPKSKSPLGMVYGWIYRTDYNLLRKPNWGRIDVWC